MKIIIQRLFAVIMIMLVIGCSRESNEKSKISSSVSSGVTRKTIQVYPEEN